MPRRNITRNNRTSRALRYKARLLRQAAEGATPYQYSPLNEGAQEIRLMTLFPETVSSEIRVSLEIVPFTKDHVHDFEALSYAWGSAENLVDIIIGASGHEVLSITQNLAEALPYLRYEDRSRVLWIDAICVNQQDLEERSRQVERMADIFAKASRVVVWLGPESSDSSVAIDCFHTISENVEVDQVTLSARSLSNEHTGKKHMSRYLSVTHNIGLYIDFYKGVGLNISGYGKKCAWDLETRLSNVALKKFCGGQCILLYFAFIPSVNLQIFLYQNFFPLREGFTRCAMRSRKQISSISFGRPKSVYAQTQETGCLQYYHYLRLLMITLFVSSQIIRNLSMRYIPRRQFTILSSIKG